MNRSIFYITLLMVLSCGFSSLYGLEPQYSLTREPTKNILSSSLKSKFIKSVDTTEYKVWIGLRDKGIYNDTQFREKVNSIQSTLPERTLSRRNKMKHKEGKFYFLDIPVNPSYIHQIKRKGVVIDSQSKWFNAVSIRGTKSQIEEISLLPFVYQVEQVMVYQKPIEPVEPVELDKVQSVRFANDSSLIYGPSSTQIYQINVHLLHEDGYHGEGVTVGLLDTGFRRYTHEALTSVFVLDEYDFINNDTVTYDELGDPAGQEVHGSRVLSQIAGYEEDFLYGPAYKSSYLLAKTEKTDEEIMAEEDYWIAGIEWLESNGAEVISSSLGYYNFDDGTTTYDYSYMDGETRTTSIAAEIAYQLGVVVCNAVGNNGTDSNYPYIIAPADGLHVVSVGAVNSSGARVSFSAKGPTYDGRIKPDVMALGSGNFLVLSNTTAGYSTGSGTSFSTPLVAGVVALLLQIHPYWTPDDIIQALHATASQSTMPDDYKGWGIVNAYQASLYQPPTKVPYGEWENYN